MSTQVFIIAFVVSYLGSIPPGTINITSMQLSVQNHQRAAFFFALAASITEFAYAGVTVRLQLFLSEKPFFTEYFQIITALAMLALGVANLLTKTNSQSLLSKTTTPKGRNGFKLGVILGVLNPLTIPFWLAVTAYLQNHRLISLSGVNFWLYLSGISIGTFALLLTVNRLGARFTNIADNQLLVHRLPGIIFILLGLYNFIDWLF
ncbi:LysE family transporter [Marinoscillum luteum]|uniref:LysE family transporter n=1 Tax=Marinoscillum luteum TaxID=861051 RepID=A0ABW7NBS9_9BACT